MKQYLICGSAILASLAAGCDSGSSPSATATTTPPAPPVIKEAYYSFDGSTSQKIKYEEKDGLALFQGDIVLPLSSGKKGPAALGRTNALRWDRDGLVVYDLESMPVDLRENWVAAMAHVSRRTNLRFTRDKDIYKTITGVSSAGPIYSYSYIRVVPNTSFAGGYSEVGRTLGGSGQVLGLSSGVGAGLITHELLHAIGHWHEQSRGDRNTFVQVNAGNIEAGKAHNFDIHASDGQMIGAYDYCSIMHYHATAFSSNGLPTLQALNTFACDVTNVAGTVNRVTAIGQQLGLSDADIQAVANRHPGIPAARPFAFAGFDQNVTASPGTYSYTFTLDARRSFAMDGSALRFAWKPVGFVQCQPGQYVGCSTSNPIANNTSAVATVSVPLNGTYGGPRVGSGKYELIVTDNAGRTMRDIVSVKVTAY